MYIKLGVELNKNVNCLNFYYLNFNEKKKDFS